MIIYGTGGKVLTNDNDKTLPCSYCNTSNSVYIYKQLKYFHIFWIPMFPYSNTLITQCESCKQISYENDLNPESKEIVRSSFKKKTPLGYFAGLLIIGAFILFVTISGIIE